VAVLVERQAQEGSLDGLWAHPDALDARIRGPSVCPAVRPVPVCRHPGSQGDPCGPTVAALHVLRDEWCAGRHVEECALRCGPGWQRQLDEIGALTAQWVHDQEVTLDCDVLGQGP